MEPFFDVLYVHSSSDSGIAACTGAGKTDTIQNTNIARITADRRKARSFLIGSSDRAFVEVQKFCLSLFVYV